MQAEGWGQTFARPFGNLYAGETFLQMAVSKEKPPLSSPSQTSASLISTRRSPTRKPFCSAALPGSTSRMMIPRASSGNPNRSAILY